MNDRVKLAWFPVEVGAREIPSRLVFAFALAELGWVSVVGHKNSVDAMVSSGPAGIYTYKNTHKMAGPRFARARSRGNLTIAVEEEILNFYSEDINGSFVGNYQLEPEVMRYVDFYACSNKADFRLASLKARSTNILKVGSLRSAYSYLVSLSPREQVAPNSILVNGRIGYITGSRLSDYLVWNAGAVGFRRALIDLRDTVVEESAALLELVEFMQLGSSDYQITFRRHPAESSDLYKNILGQSVSFDEAAGPVQHKFGNHSLVVGYSCTTLLEACLAGLKVVNFGGAAKSFISDRAISHVGSREFLRERLPSSVDLQLINDELFQPQEVLKRWIGLFEESALSECSVPLTVVRAGMSDSAKARYGEYDEIMLRQDYSIAKAAGLAARSPVVKNFGEIIVVAPG